MDNDKEKQIRFLMKMLSQIEPQNQATQNALDKVRNSLVQTEKRREAIAVRILRVVFCGRAIRYMTAAVILIGIGFIAGRLAVPKQPEINVAEIQSMIDKKCAEFAEKTLSASSTLMDQRMNNIIGLVEAAREKDRQWVAAAFQKIESDRKADNTRVGNSLVALAARTNELHGYEQN